MDSKVRTLTLEPFYQAIAAGDLTAIAQHIAAGIDVIGAREVDHPRLGALATHMTPVGWAAYCSDRFQTDTTRDVVNALLSAGADPLIYGPVLHASSATAIELLADAGADPNAALQVGHADELGSTALMFRAEAQDLASVELLLVLNVDAAKKNASGQTALDYAGRGRTPIRTPADVDVRVATLNTLSMAALPPLAWSRAMLSLTAVDILTYTTEIITLPDGTPVEKTIYSRTPVSVRPILELMEFNGGNPADAIEPGAGSRRRNLVMMMLANYGFRFEPFDELVWLLRRYGFALLEQGDSEGRSVLHHVFNPSLGDELPKPQTSSLVRALLAFNADPNFRDNTGSSPLHELVRRACRPKDILWPYPWPCDPPGASRPPCAECIESIRLLRDAGGDPKLQDFSGKTPASEARARPNCPLRNYLPTTALMASRELASESEADEGDAQADSEEEDPPAAPEEPDHWDFVAVLPSRPELDALWAYDTRPLVPHAPENYVSRDERSLAALASDPQATQLHSEAKTLYEDANRAYLADPQHVDPYIRINPGNGRRSTLRQGQLYEQYIHHAFYGGPPAPRANRPGKSPHEYGFAMDIIRAGDETRLAAALSGAGWDQVVDDEAWHWEAIDAASYSSLRQFIDDEMDPLSERWALTLSSFYERRKERFALLPELELAQRELANLLREVEDGRRVLASEGAALEAEEARLRQLYDDILAADKNIIALQRQRANMRYTKCPNGAPYETCDHPNYKREYDEEVRQADLAIQRERARRTAMAQDYDDSRRRLPQRRAQYSQRMAAWRRKSQQVAPARQKVASKRAAIARAEREMTKARTASAAQLNEINAKVKAWG